SEGVRRSTQAPRTPRHCFCRSSWGAMPELVLNVNGKEHVVGAAPGTPLLTVLRNELGLKGAKFGCGLEQCYACAVIVEGESVPSCATAVEAFAGKRITTVEGLGAPGRL